MHSISFSLRCLALLACVMSLNALQLKNQLESSNEVSQYQQGLRPPTSPYSIYYKGELSWYATYGLIKAHGLYCRNGKVVEN